jgi:formate hydrogenlyase subunit 4
MLLEYSGKRLALMEWSAASKLFIFSALAANLYFPVGIATDASLPAIGIGILALLAKVLAIYVAIAMVESSLAKFRFFRLPDLLFVAFILSAVAVGLIS